MPGLFAAPHSAASMAALTINIPAHCKAMCNAAIDDQSAQMKEILQNAGLRDASPAKKKLGTSNKDCNPIDGRTPKEV